MTSRPSSIRTLLVVASLLAIAVLGTAGPSGLLVESSPAGAGATALLHASAVASGRDRGDAGIHAGPRAAASTTALAHYGRLSLAFEPNRGQTAHQVEFLAHGPGYTLFLTGSDAVVSLTRSTFNGLRSTVKTGPRATQNAARSTQHPHRRTQNLEQGNHKGLPLQSQTSEHRTVVRLHFLGANVHPTVVGLDRLPGHVSYFIGNNPARWHTGIRTFAKVELRNVYPGIDAVYYGHGGRLEYDLVVHPGARASAVRFRIEGTGQPRLEPGGDLLLGSGADVLRLGKPILYQEVAGSRRTIAGGYAFGWAPGGSGLVRIRVGRYDPTRSLVIDPTLDYSTYLGISGSTTAAGIAVDSAGDAYVTGQDDSPASFPTCPGGSRAQGDDECTSTSGSPLQATSRGASSAFVSELDPSGTELIYSTYFGGTNNQAGNAIAVDGSGHAYVTGWTTSGQFPTCPTYDQFSGTDVTPIPDDPCATTSGTTLQVQNGNKNFSHDIAVGETGFVAELNPGGTKLVYSTYLGGNGANGANDSEGDSGNGIAVDGAGDAYVTGSTYSTNFPTKNALQSQNRTSSYTSFVSEINPSGTALIYSTYLGGSGEGDSGNAIAVAGTGGVGPACTSQCAAYVAGQTFSTDFPTRNALQSGKHGSGGNSNAFVAEVNPNGTGLAYSTYLGGSGANGGDSASGIAVDANGAAYVTGATGTTDFPTCPGVGSDPCTSSTGTPLQSAFGGGAFDAFAAKLTPNGTQLAYSTYLGGNGTSTFFPEGGSGIAVDATGNAYVTGSTDSSNFPTCPGSSRPAGSDPCTSATGTPLQSSLQGSNTDDAFVAALNPSGTQLTYSTFLGGSNQDFGNGVAVDANGAAYVAGNTESTNFPLCPNSPPTSDPCTSGSSPPLQLGSNSSGNFGFVAKLSAVPDTFTVVGVGDAGTGCAGVPSPRGSVTEPSLRCALIDANNDTNATPALIAFDVTSGCTGNVCTISPATALPVLSRNNTTIDGYSQPGASPNTNTTLAGGDNAKILIQLDNETSSGGVAVNLDVTGSNVVVDGLSITAGGTGAPTGVAVENGARNDLIAGNYIGPTPSGSMANASTGLGVGVRLDGAVNTVGAADFQGEPFGGLNVISGARAGGVVVTGSNLTVQDSYIGTGVTGTGIVGNGSGADGVDVTTASSPSANSAITIGPNAVISGNQNYGLFICNTTGSTVSGDEIGTNAGGTAAVANGKGGIDVQGGCQVGGAAPALDSLTIGGTTPDARNVISGNGFSTSSGFGIRLDAFAGPVSGVTIEGNYIGTDIHGTAQVPNQGPGVRVQSDEATSGSATWAATGNTIGGPGGVPGSSACNPSSASCEGNLISGNTGDGISIGEVPNVPASGNAIEGNLVGTTVDGTVALGNGGNGVTISTNGDILGGFDSGDSNLISGNSGAGVLLNNTATDCTTKINGTLPGNTLAGNRIGTTTDGMARVPNGANGIDVAGPCNAIGLDKVQAGGSDVGNLVSGNTGDGVLVSSGGTGSTLFNDDIGTGAGGGSEVPNSHFGVDLNAATSITVGGPAQLADNTISGNGGGGVLLQNGAHGNTIADNKIGTSSSGTGALGNDGDGVSVSGSSGNTISSDTISDNSANGITLTGAASNTISSDTINTNGSDGISVSGAANNGISADTITANGANGVEITGSGSTGDSVSGDTISQSGGTVSGLSNTDNGVYVHDGAQGETIGTDTITNNGGAGVLVGNPGAPNDHVRAVISSDAINANGGLAIRLTGQFDCTQGLDTSGTKPNDSTPCPSITSLSGTSPNVTVSGTACAGCLVQLFMASNDANENQQGGSLSLVTSGTFGTCASPPCSGTVSWSFSGLSIPVGTLLSATATQQNTSTSPATPLETSEFGPNFPVTVNVPIGKGWNLIAVPVHNATLASASGIVSNINGSPGLTGAISALATYSNGRFTLFVPGFSSDIIGIQPSQGLFVLSKASGTWPATGAAFIAGQFMVLGPGWNLVAAPYPPAGLGSDVIANQIDSTCSATQTCTVKEIATYTGSSYRVYQPGVSGSTPFNVPNTSGVWIEMSQRAFWLPH